MNDDLTLLASTYLDGTATVDERVRVESDPELLAEVERLRQVRAVLGDPEPAPISTRERHLAAALDAWDRLPSAERSGVLDATPAGADPAAVAGAASVTAPISLDDRRRFRSSRRLLAVAASLVVVLGAGLVVRSALRSTGSDDSADTAAVVEQSAELSARDALEIRAADETFGDGADAPAEAADAPAAPADEDTLLGSDEAPPEDGLVVLGSAEDLLTYADLLVRDPVIETDDAGEPAATIAAAFESCAGVDRIVGPALWSSEGVPDTPVVVGIDDDSGEAIAYDDETCAVVARAKLTKR